MLFRMKVDRILEGEYFRVPLLWGHCKVRFQRGEHELGYFYLRPINGCLVVPATDLYSCTAVVNTKLKETKRTQLKMSQMLIKNFCPFNPD